MEVKTRTGLDKIASDVQMALSLYYKSKSLREYIIRWSRKETQEKLEERRDRTLTKYRNYPREVANKYIEGLLRRQDAIRRTSSDPDFAKFLNGWYDDWFWREIAPIALILPEVWAMAIPMGKRAFRPAVVFPQYVTNFASNPSGDIVEVDLKLKETTLMHMDGVGTSYASRMTGDKGELYWTKMESSDNGPSESQHGLDFCPIVRIAYEENVSIAAMESTPVGHAFMYDTLMMTQGDLQFRSMFMEAAHDHLHYQLVMGEQTARATIAMGMGSDTPVVETKEEHNTTRYLGLPQVQLTELNKIIHEDNPREIFEQARLQSRFSSSAQTGPARELDLWPENGVLTTISGFFWRIDDQIVQMLARANGVKAEVRWPTIFDMRTPSDTLKDTQQFFSLASKSGAPASERALREMTKNVQRTLNPTLPSELLDIIDKESDRAPIPFLNPPSADLPGAQPSPVGLPATGPQKGPQGQGGNTPQAPAGGPASPSAASQDGGANGQNAVPTGRPGGGSGGSADAGTGASKAGGEVHAGMEIVLAANVEAREEEDYEDIVEAFEKAGYTVTFLNVQDNLDRLFSITSDTPFVFNAIEQFFDRSQFEMNVAAYFELAHVRYTGSSAKTLGLVQDKALTKTVLAGVGLACVRAVLVRPDQERPATEHLTWPRMVKFAAEDASEGITSANVTNNEREMEQVIDRLWEMKPDAPIFIEEYIDGREILVAVLGNGDERRCLPPIEIMFEGKSKIVTEDSKTKPDSEDFNSVMSQEAELTDAERAAVEDAALMACRATEIRDYARVDIRLKADGVAYVIEINPNPDLTPEHGFGGSAALAGLDFPALLDTIVQIARKRYEDKE
jgi:D-alanine-D-alanine ligase